MRLLDSWMNVFCCWCFGLYSLFFSNSAILKKTKETTEKECYAKNNHKERRKAYIFCEHNKLNEWVQDTFRRTTALFSFCVLLLPTNSARENLWCDWLLLCFPFFSSVFIQFPHCFIMTTSRGNEKLKVVVFRMQKKTATAPDDSLGDLPFLMEGGCSFFVFYVSGWGFMMLFHWIRLFFVLNRAIWKISIESNNIISNKCYCSNNKVKLISINPLWTKNHNLSPIAPSPPAFILPIRKGNSIETTGYLFEPNDP